MNYQFLEQLREIMDSSYMFEQEFMKKHTTFRVGGPADVLVQPNRKELANIIKLCKKNVKLSAIFLKTTEKPRQVNGQMNKVNVFIRNSEPQNPRTIEFLRF